MNKLKVMLGAACLIGVMSSQPAHAQLVDYASRASFEASFSSPNVETWNEFAPGTLFSNGSGANGITYNVNDGKTAEVVTDFASTSGPNSLGVTTTSFFYPSDTITFTFAQPVTAFSVDLDTFETGTNAYLATTNTGDVAGSIYDPFPGLTTGEFIGFSDTSPFNSVTLSDQSSFDGYTLSTLQYVDSPSLVNSSPVPEPPTMALMLAGLLVMLLLTAKGNESALLARKSG